jgi:hypothetical protein
MNFVGLIFCLGIGFFAFRNRWISASMALFALSFNNVAEAYLNSAHVTNFAFKVNLSTTIFVYDFADIIGFAAVGLYCAIIIKTFWLGFSKQPSNVWFIRKAEEYEAKKKLIAGVEQAGVTGGKK